MDPPTCSSNSSRKRLHDGPVTPKSRNTNHHVPNSSPRPPFFSDSSPYKHYDYATRCSPSSQKSAAIPLQRSRNVAKIIKGEIHNVLTVMRSDPRYYTADGDGGTSVSGRSRFEYEERQNVTGKGRFWSNSGGSTYSGMMRRLDDSSNNSLSTSVGSFATHPILQGLRDLYDTLSIMESEYFAGGDGDTKLPLSATTFVEPFAAAVCSADVDAKTTGAALSALHKFIVYGFLEGHSSSEDVRESITIVARCIPQCSFEETTQKASPGGRAFWSSAKDEQSNTSSFMIKHHISTNNDGEAGVATNAIPQFLLQPRRKKTAKGNTNSRLSALSSADENVILKILSLSVQVLRCSAGRSYLSPSDIVAIFDTCLLVSLASGEANHSLLRSAAADALSLCAIVVFGMRAGRDVKDRELIKRNEPLPDEDTADPTTEDGDSDDDWGERDPTVDIEDSFLITRLETNKSPPIVNEKSRAGGNESSPSHTREDIRNNEEEPALVAIMARLATMADPLVQQDDTCILSLTLINIALETMSDIDAMTSKYHTLLGVMQSDLSRNLLRLSTSSDLTLLGLALRVIFNLFNGLKQNMKVHLEVFLTSVHLRILSSSKSPEHRELALESLLEFCREPMLMMDLYLNYDCDINCTNLFETICITLAQVANPEGHKSSKSEPDEDNLDNSYKPRLNILNRLAAEGLIAVVDSIANRCKMSSKFPMIPFALGFAETMSSDLLPDTMKPSPPDSGNSDILGNLISIHETGSLSSSSDIVTPIKHLGYTNVRANSDISDLDLEAISKTGHHKSLALRERKIRKKRLAKASAAFNESARDKEWIAELERLGVVPNPATPESIANFLYSSSEKLDQAKIGEYISKGPKEKYPFIEKVLYHFAQLFDFSELSFSESLRLFLSTFRLPGEAQCIDRLMEAFAQRLYEGHNSCNADDNAAKTMLDPPRHAVDGETNSRSGLIDPPTDENNHVLFKSADAAFILAFSTIMLNTDQHNPNMDDAKRMTLEQFVRNNRGINEGEDLPLQFLEELYFEIKHNEIQMKKSAEANDFDGLLVERANMTAPFFSSSNTASKFTQAGVHERDMFVAISSTATKALSAVFVQSWDDSLVVKALNGLRSSANICAYFGLTNKLDEIMDLLLSWGQDYLDSVSKLQYMGSAMSNDVDETVLPCSDDELDIDQLNASLVKRDLPPLPTSFVTSLNGSDSNQSIANDVTGSAAHRGLLSLQAGLSLCKSHLSSIDEALPMLIEVIFALRDVDALPPRLTDLDDFADAQGNALRASKFADNAFKRLNAYKNSLSTTPKSSSNSGLLSMFSFGTSSKESEALGRSNPLITVLNAVSNNASLDQIIMKMSDVSLAKRVFSSMLSAAIVPEDDAMIQDLFADPTYEHNAVFVLELAARLLISNRSHSAELMPIFVSKLETMFSPLGDNSDDSLALKFPYLLERIIVTILRAAIHLYDIPDSGLRIHITRSIEMILTLPCSYIKEISSRLGCGSAIVLRGCFLLFETRKEWAAIRNLLDSAAKHNEGRPFVFDGIASLIDFAFPIAVNDEPSLELSADGCEALRYLLLKFLEGSYENDLNYKLPAMMYMKRLYSTQNSSSDSLTSISLSQGSAQEEEWTKMVGIIYNDVCLSHDSKTARKGFESLQEVLLSTNVELISDDQWLTLIKMACKTPPKVDIQAARIDSLNLIGRLFMTLMPSKLSNRKENWAQLEDYTLALAEIVGENLHSGRSTPLFEMTVHHVTNICNVMNMSGFNDEGKGINFCSWVGDVLVAELEKVGASGKVQAAR